MDQAGGAAPAGDVPDRPGQRVLPTAGTCVAVGSTGTPDAAYTLSETWRAAWSIQVTPDPTGSSHSVFSSVSCPSPTSCTTVGASLAAGHSEVTPGAIEPIAEAGNGTTWRLEAVPQFTTTDGVGEFSFAAVSCPSPTVCRIVGEATFPGSTVVLAFAGVWNGSSWTQEPVVGPTDAYAFVIAAVACPPGSTACTGVGSWAPTEPYFGAPGGADSSAGISLTLAETIPQL